MDKKRIPVLLGDEQRCERASYHGPSNEGVLGVAGLVSTSLERIIEGFTYPPLLVSYRSVRARLVGVSFTHVARSLRILSRVSVEVTAAVKHSQSPTSN